MRGLLKGGGEDVPTLLIVLLLGVVMLGNGGEVWS